MTSAFPLEDCLSPCAVIRTTFETFGYFPPDDPMRDEMHEIITDARKTLALQLEAVAEQFLINPQNLKLTADILGSRILWFLRNGIPGDSINACFKVDVFRRDETVFLTFEDGKRIEDHHVLTMPAHIFFAMQANSLRTRAENAENYADGSTFDREVYRPLMQLMFLFDYITNPLFYR